MTTTTQPTTLPVPTSPDSMLDRVANALATALFNDYQNIAKHIAPDVIDPITLALARAVIAAMREPTQGMKECSDEVHWGYSCYVCGGLKEGWYAMIDAALKGE